MIYWRLSVYAVYTQYYFTSKDKLKITDFGFFANKNDAKGVIKALDNLLKANQILLKKKLITILFNLFKRLS